MAREEFDYWTGTGSGPLDGRPPTSFAEALNRISSQWLSHDFLTSSPGGLEDPRATEPAGGRASCGAQTAPDAPPALQRPARWGPQDMTLPSYEDSPPSRMGWSPASEAGLPYAAGQGDEAGAPRVSGKEGGWRRSEGEVGRDGQREWYQRMLLAMKLKQVKRTEDMEVRFEEELRRRSQMHEAALQQMAAQAAVASSSAQACAAAQEAARVLEEKLRVANEMLGGMQARVQQQEEDLELKREYDLYKLRSVHEKETAALSETHQAKVDQLQAQLRQAVTAHEEEREAEAALQLRHEAEMRHLRTEHEAKFASAHAQVLAAQQAVAARAEAEAAHTELAVAEVRREYDVKLAAAMRAMQDSHAERCSLLEQDMQQVVQRQSQEYELVIDELRALLASRDSEAEPVPLLRGGSLAERPESPLNDSLVSPRGRSRTGQRPAAPLKSAPLPPRPCLKRTQSSPPRMGAPSRPAPPSVPKRSAKPPVESRKPMVRAQPVAPPVAEPVALQRGASADFSLPAVAPVSRAQPPIPYQQLITSLQVLDRRRAASPSPPREERSRANEQEGVKRENGLQIETVDRSLQRARQGVHRVPDAKRVAGTSYLDRLLRQLKLEQQQQGARRLSRDTELLSSGDKSLPDWHATRRSAEGSTGLGLGTLDGIGIDP